MWYLVKVDLLAKGGREGGGGELGRLTSLQSPWICQVPGDDAHLQRPGWYGRFCRLWWYARSQADDVVWSDQPAAWEGDGEGWPFGQSWPDPNFPKTDQFHYQFNRDNVILNHHHKCHWCHQYLHLVSSICPLNKESCQSCAPSDPQHSSWDKYQNINVQWICVHQKGNHQMLIANCQTAPSIVREEFLKDLCASTAPREKEKDFHDTFAAKPELCTCCVLSSIN